MSAAEIKEIEIEIREGTTRYVNITCKSAETGENFDFDNYTVQTHLSFGYHQQYVQNTIIENVISYKIPAKVSVGEKRGVAETRIYKDGDVFEVLRINVSIKKAEKPDIVPLAQ